MKISLMVRTLMGARAETEAEEADGTRKDSTEEQEGILSFKMSL